MPRAVAKKDKDGITGTCAHMVQPPGAPPPPPKPEKFSFDAKFGTNLSPDVYAEGKNVAHIGSKVRMMPGLIPTTGVFISPPSNSGKVITGSSTVYVNNIKIARNNDLAEICADPVDVPAGRVVAGGTVFADD